MEVKDEEKTKIKGQNQGFVDGSGRMSLAGRTTPPITSTVMDAREVTETRPVAMETTIWSLKVELSCRNQTDVFNDSSETAEMFKST